MTTNRLIHTSLAGFGTGLLLWLALLCVPFASHANDLPSGRIDQGHSAMWYDPSRSGEGWVLEILANDSAVMYWFTYDEVGNPRWLSGAGSIIRDDETGDRIEFPELIAPRGGRFGHDFDPADVVRETVGHASFTFDGCDSGQIEFDAFGATGSFPLTRLTKVMGAGCGIIPAHGIPGVQIDSHAGQSGSWFDPAYSGQGYTLQWMADDGAMLVWFTFDPQGRPYWMVGTGQREGARIVFEPLYSTSGGRFAEDFDPADVIRKPWGRLELRLACDTGEAGYTPTEPGFAWGSFNLTRLTRLEKSICPWVTKLTDLYELEWTALPALSDSEGGIYPAFGVRSIADDGTVVGHIQGHRMALLRAGSNQWEDIGETTRTPFITPDGKTIYSFTEHYTSPFRGVVSVWNEDQGNQPIHDAEISAGTLLGMSHDGSWVIGDGRDDTGPFNWKWSSTTGLVRMTREGRPVAISDDGHIVIGNIPQPSLYIGPPFVGDALQWVGAAPAAPLAHAEIDHMRLQEARACNFDCSMILGVSGSWYRLGDGSVITSPPLTLGLGPLHVSRDGSVVANLRSLVSHNDRLWTQNTGVVILKDLIEEETPAGTLPLWPHSLVSVSSDGMSLLLQYDARQTPNAPRPQNDLVILRLIPK